MQFYYTAFWAKEKPSICKPTFHKMCQQGYKPCSWLGPQSFGQLLRHHLTVSQEIEEQPKQLAMSYSFRRGA